MHRTDRLFVYFRYLNGATVLCVAFMVSHSLESLSSELLSFCVGSPVKIWNQSLNTWVDGTVTDCLPYGRVGVEFFTSLRRHQQADVHRAIGKAAPSQMMNVILKFSISIAATIWSYLR